MSIPAVQMNTPSQHDHDMMFGGVMVSSSAQVPPPHPESAQSNNVEGGYTTVARFLADEETARDGMEVKRMPAGMGEDISDKVTRVIPMENFPVATNESLESLQEPNPVLLIEGPKFVPKSCVYLRCMHLRGGK